MQVRYFALLFYLDYSNVHIIIWVIFHRDLIDILLSLWLIWMNNLVNFLFSQYYPTQKQAKDTTSGYYQKGLVFMIKSVKIDILVQMETILCNEWTMVIEHTVDLN